MPETGLCPYISTEPGHFGCLLPADHRGEHHGVELGCSPNYCNHGAGSLVPEDGARVLSVTERTALAERLDGITVADMRALRADPEAMQALAQEVAPDPSHASRLAAGIAISDAPSDAVARIRFVMTLLTRAQTEAIVTFQARMLLDPRTARAVARPLLKAGQVGKKTGHLAALEQLHQDALRHFSTVVPNASLLHSELIDAAPRDAPELPSPPDLFATVVLGVATARLEPKAFTYDEVYALSKAWEEATGDKDRSGGSKTTVSEVGCYAAVILIVAIIGFAAISSWLGW